MNDHPTTGKVLKARSFCSQAFRKRRCLAASSLLLACLLSSCQQRWPAADLVIINGNEPESLDPAIVTGISEMRLTKALFEGLIRLDAKTAEPIPGLAERWEVSTDGKIYSFHLRTNAVWSTGEPITAADVAYSWLRALDPATAADYAGQLFYIKNAEDYYTGKLKDPKQLGFHVAGQRLFQVELNQPLAFFLEVCAFPATAVVPRQTIDKLGDRWLSAQPLPCSGPYQLVAWRLNDRVRLRKNPLYWDAANTRNELIDILPVGSPNAALNLYETGIADIVWDKDLVPSELLDVLMKRPDFHTSDYLGTCFYRFNVTKKPFEDARVRRAFALATNKDRIIQKLAHGGEKAASHYVPDGTAHYQSPPGLHFDPEQARRLLAEAGFPAGAAFPRVAYSFYTAASGGAKMQEKIAVELQQMWRSALGVEVELRQVERKIFLSAQSRLEYDISGSSWIGDYDDANTFLDMYVSSSGNNRTGWKNPRYDELIHQANLQTDLGRRAELFRQAETLLIAEEVPIVPLYFYAGFNYFDPNKIEGVYQNILDEHPLQSIRKIRPQARAQRPAQLELGRNHQAPLRPVANF